MTKHQLPPNTRVKKNGWIEFRKLYNGEIINKAWPPGQEKAARDEIYKILAKINRNEKLFEFEEQRITMTQAADVFWELHGSKKPSTDGFKSYLKRIRDYFGTKWFDSVTHEDVE